MRVRKKHNPDHHITSNRVNLVRGGKPYFDCMVEMIGSARNTIHLQTYIYAEDETGRLVTDALKEAAKRNVAVYVVVDGFASGGLTKAFQEELAEAGIHFRFFEPLLKSKYFYLGRRLHHKILVVDSTCALVGGVNFTDRYNDMPGQKAWLDFAVSLEGDAAKQLCGVCTKIWNNDPQGVQAPACETEAKFDFQADEVSEVTIRRNDWVRRRNEISFSYISMIRNAKSHVIILCSYFLPGRIIRRTLARAARRGISIKVITAGTSDVKTAKYAERYLYDWMLRNKIQLYEYQPTVLHGKIAVCDGEWATVGSYNINDLSAYASVELNVNIKDGNFTAKTEKVLQDIMDNDCIPVTKEWLNRTRNPVKRFAQWLAYGFIRMALYVFTFYFKPRK